ncbi:DUF167 domain-containing protein [Sphingomonas cavernae]|uniref:UPF0235 protein D3876_05200 n=1 Tax=Sphingomonas cavernae TaxID=2320861 RepID=A0A418WR45_9SPHN|nr:DUF167 domain-containing protein [Sphingomonas cavernae]RJF93697.1 DUF167 domain-containing protein [Sphingomonas cavernae]
MAVWRADAKGITVSVRVTPRASRDAVLEPKGGWLPVRLRAPPVEGAANGALVRFLASALDLPRRDVMIRSGEAARLKHVRLEGDPERLAEALERLYRASP